MFGSYLGAHSQCYLLADATLDKAVELSSFFCTGNTVTQQVQCMVYIIYNTLRYINSTVVQNTSKIKAYESKVEFSFNSGSKRVG